MPKMLARIAHEYDQMFLVKKNLFTMIKNHIHKNEKHFFHLCRILIILSELKSRGQ